MNLTQKHAEITLPYFKQGDDLNQCISKNSDGSVNAKQTLENYVNLLECVIQQLKSINEIIPETNNITLNGDTHYIGIYGDEQIINTLIERKLAYKIDCDETSDDTSDTD